MKKEEYSGFEIKFDESREVWFTYVKEKDDDTTDTRLENQSLKKLKELLDIVKRRKFTRMSVFVRADSYLHSDDKKYSPKYANATLTSIAPNGNAYVVKKGEKHAERFSLSYNSYGIILDTPENRKFIAEIEKQGEIEWRAKRELEKLEEKLETIDGPKVYKQVYGKDLD